MRAGIPNNTLITNGLNRSRFRSSKGLSLVELLVVLSIIGILAAISISKYQGLQKGAERATARRNAQTLAMVASSAQAVGNLTIGEATTIDDAVSVLMNGPSSGIGVFSDMDFKVSDLSDDDVELAKEYLDFENGQLVYQPNGEEVSTGYLK